MESKLAMMRDESRLEARSLVDRLEQLSEGKASHASQANQGRAMHDTSHRVLTKGARRPCHA